MNLSSDQTLRVEQIATKFQSLERYVKVLADYLKDNPNPTNAKLRLKRVESFYDEYSQLNEELFKLQPTHALIESFQELSNLYYEVATSTTVLFEGPSAHSTLNNSNITITERQDRPRLPDITIEKFDGSRKNWAIFKSNFVTLVHNRTDLSDDFKAGQLFSLLTGSARSKVQEYDPCADDYANAWQALLDSYDHKRIVANRHLNAILDLPKVRGDRNSKGVALSDLYDTARQHLNVLKRIDAQPSDEIVVRIIERCLPPYLFGRWNDKLEVNQLPSRESLFQFIQKAIFKQEAFDESNDYSSNSRKRPAGSAIDTSNPKSRAKSLVTTTSNASTSPAPASVNLPCPKCKGTHRLFKCDAFKSLEVQERWRFAKQNDLCFNCLWKHPRPCSSNKHCKHQVDNKPCGKNHHTLLHSDTGSKPKGNKDTSSSNTPQA
ncbi:uncharacterized protein LOC131664381 [Phymastichus coffea]|uniref:uncharacterized protein LOC131664381 n=1 Tax=Phymastichus coffea TaxID=108790 RepID=UPI00273C5649|nr:uncharacterized protein LOC131664381 [Phymastichus coffea]